MKEIDEAKQKLEEVGIDTSKIKEAYDFDKPIHKPSACDVYRNNKSFLKRLQQMSKYDSVRGMIPEKFWADNIKEAEELFDKMNKTLPINRYNKLRKIFDSFKDVFKL